MGTMEGGEEDIIPGPGGSEEKIYVSVRLRPLNEKEILNNDVSDWECINDTTIIYKNASFSPSERSMYPTAYTFDRVFRRDCPTRLVYEQAAKEVALAVVSGINASVFAYGQTSSGKTYTMTGITEYAIADIFEYVQKHPERQFLLKFSAMEIYNESVRDLLSPDASPLRLLDDPERGTVIEKLTEETLRDWNHVTNLLSVCEAQRQIGETALNETSSRSHQIIKLTIESSAREFLGRDNLSTLAATVNFVDLAGSERASQSLSAGTRLKEGCHINRSLLTLGTVIRKLSKSRNGHIPFRDSKLTRILQPSLGGNARTAIICTMSPARSHVEQSRNTLLFASCAKEVTTSAQVNVVMSDKALVKHLQRELARLEGELRSPASTFIPSKFQAILREKDLQIEKLEREVKDLILQRDIAQSQLKDLLRVRGDEGELSLGLDHYPNLRIRRSPDSHHQRRDASTLVDTRAVDVDIQTCSNGHSRSSSEDQFMQVPEFEENPLHTPLSPQPLIRASNYSETDSCQGWEDYDKQSDGTSEECRVVRCIETEEASVSTPIQPRISFPELIVLGNAEEEADSISPISERYIESVSPSIKGETEVRSVTLEESQEVASQSMQEDDEPDKELTNVPSKEKLELAEESLIDDQKPIPLRVNNGTELNCFCADDIPLPEKSSPRNKLMIDSSGSTSLKLTRSRSCLASLNGNAYSSWIENLENIEHTPPCSLEREFAPRPGGFERKISFLNFCSNIQGSSSKHSPSSEVPTDGDLETRNGESPSDDNVIRLDRCHTETKEMTGVSHQNDSPEIPAKEAEVKDNLSNNKVKDVGLDPIEDDFKGFTSWPMDFKRLQREIIELWHECHVSLVHRSYFFLLFQGDPTDAIYLEVELRRLSFLRDTFSRGEKTVVNGRTLSLSSSMKALRHERRKLSKVMLKKFSEQERETLYLKYGIGLNTKYRRVQLAHILWTKTHDLNHIADSAFLVAKLAGLIEPGLAPKEMFGLNFAPRSTTSPYSFKRSLISLL